MFNSLSGIVTGKFQKQLLLDTHGIEWNIIVPDSCLDDFPAVEKSAKVFTWMNHYENGMDLYGFATENQRKLFLDLLKVDGIGPKGAVKIMSSITAENLITSLENADVSVLEKVSGIGKKTAAKMVLALKGKLTVYSEDNLIERKSQWDIIIQSLCDMGYERKNASDAVNKAAASLCADGSFNSLSKQDREDMIFKKSLIELAN